eukprot:jgi/Ulvmu1/7609/UM038_0034.1
MRLAAFTLTTQVDDLKAGPSTHMGLAPATAEVMALPFNGRTDQIDSYHARPPEASRLCSFLSVFEVLATLLQRSQNHPGVTAAQVREGAGVSLKWLLHIVKALSRQIPAASTQPTCKLSEQRLATAILATAQTAEFLDLVPLSKSRMATRCTVKAAKACATLAAEATKCMQGRSALMSWDLQQAGGETRHLLRMLRGLRVLGMRQHSEQLVIGATSVVLASKDVVHAGELLRYLWVWDVKDYRIHDHFFLLAVEQAEYLHSNVLQLLDSTASALRMQYMPSDDAQQVIFSQTLQALRDDNVEAAKLFLRLLDQDMHMHSTLVCPLAQMIRAHAADFTPYQLLLAWHSFAQVNDVQPDFEAVVLDRVQAYLKAQHYEDVFVAGKLREVQSLWRLYDRDISFPVAMQQALDSKRQNPFISQFQRQVFKAVKEVAEDAYLEYDDQEFSIDIAIVRQDGTRVAIECDGHHHFWLNKSPHELNRRTLCRNEQLRKRGWNVVCIPLHDWKYFTQHTEQQVSQKLGSYSSSYPTISTGFGSLLAVVLSRWIVVSVVRSWGADVHTAERVIAVAWPGEGRSTHMLCTVKERSRSIQKQ